MYEWVGVLIEVEVILLHILPVVAFAVGQTEEPLLEDRDLFHSTGRARNRAADVVGNAGQAVFAPAVGARARLVVGEIIPGVAVLAVILPHRSPLPLAQVGPPLLPGRLFVRASSNRVCSAFSFGLPVGPSLWFLAGYGAGHWSGECAVAVPLVRRPTPITWRILGAFRSMLCLCFQIRHSFPHHGPQILSETGKGPAVNGDHLASDHGGAIARQKAHCLSNLFDGGEASQRNQSLDRHFPVLGRGPLFHQRR